MKRKDAEAKGCGLIETVVS